ncbi:putative uncharacterized protein [Clostridium sp. CAG:356]|jgi:hypothetical protein|nr:putative uncharacterized protein [Clostridium sp. CAG:356]
MIQFLSSWAEQIVLAVIIATIIELILPQNRNKKYIQMVIGIYILFNIISPIIKNKDTILTSGDYDLEKYESSSNYTIDQSSMDERIEKIYLEELENTTISKFQIAGIEVEKCNVDAVLNTNKKNAGIHLITVKIKGPVEQEKIDSVVKELVQEYEISEDKVKIIIR